MCVCEIDIIYFKCTYLDYDYNSGGEFGNISEFKNFFKCQHLTSCSSVPTKYEETD